MAKKAPTHTTHRAVHLVNFNGLPPWHAGHKNKSGIKREAAKGPRSLLCRKGGENSLMEPGAAACKRSCGTESAQTGVEGTVGFESPLHLLNPHAQTI